MVGVRDIDVGLEVSIVVGADHVGLFVVWGAVSTTSCVTTIPVDAEVMGTGDDASVARGTGIKLFAILS